jgi:hypothetical protein
MNLVLLRSPIATVRVVDQFALALANLNDWLALGSSQMPHFRAPHEANGGGAAPISVPLSS